MLLSPHYYTCCYFQHKTDERLQELLADDDYPGAIQVLIECQTVVATYSHFTAVKQLASKLQDTLEMMEERLDVALAKVCVDFTPTLYDRLSVAFALLGKTQTSMDQLHMHLTSAIHNTAWNVVFGHAALLQQPGFLVRLTFYLIWVSFSMRHLLIFIPGATARQEAVRGPLRLHRGGQRAAVPRRSLQGAVEHHEQLQADRGLARRGQRRRGGRM